MNSIKLRISWIHKLFTELDTIFFFKESFNELKSNSKGKKCVSVLIYTLETWNSAKKNKMFKYFRVYNWIYMSHRLCEIDEDSLCKALYTCSVRRDDWNYVLDIPKKNIHRIWEQRAFLFHVNSLNIQLSLRTHCIYLLEHDLLLCGEQIWWTFFFNEILKKYKTSYERITVHKFEIQINFSFCHGYYLLLLFSGNKIFTLLKWAHRRVDLLNESLMKLCVF